MTEIKLYNRHLEKFTEGYPLLFKEALMGNHMFDSPDFLEGTLLKLTDERGKYVATAYYGVQNKGIGWVLSKNEKEAIDSSFFKRKLYNALEKRLGLYNNPKTTAFRVFNGEGDGIGGLTIDFFDGYYLFSWYSQGILSFRDPILNAFKQLVEYDGLYEKKRFTDDVKDAGDGFIEGKPVQYPFVVKENGESLNVRFDDGAMVGFFLDQREVRKTLRDKYARGKVVLNTFSYTGAFSVFAKQGGAAHTVSVDLANRSKEATEENFKVNGIDPANESILVEDVFHFLKYAQKKPQRYDVVILDPPSFAKSKNFVFSAEKDYPELLANVIDITKDHGIIVASNNTSTIDMAKFKQIIGKGFNLANARFEILESHSLPKDFRTHRLYEYSDYLKVLFIKVIKKKG